MNVIPGVETLDGAVLKNHTTFQLGGPCRTLSFCKTEQDALKIIHHLADSDIPLLWMGSGSNLLVSDQGVEAHLVRFETDTVDFSLDGDTAIISAACNLDQVAETLAKQGRAGLNYCSGIPGTVGGALVGNAGAWGNQLGDRVQWVEALDKQGERHRFTHDECTFTYRNSAFKSGSLLITRIAITTESSSTSELLQERGEILKTRADKHPDWRIEPCIGSIFRNVDPTSKAGRRQSAGWFLEQAGMKAAKIGGAEIFEKHANIIVARAHCTAEDVALLIDSMAQAVHSLTNISLFREIRFLGEFKDHPGPRPADFH